MNIIISYILYNILSYIFTYPTLSDEKHSSSIYGNSKIENWADSDLYRHDDIIDINRMKCHELNNQGHDLYTDDYSKMSRQVNIHLVIVF